VADLYVMIGLATGDDDGTSWPNAYQDVAGFQAALDAATAGDTVHVCSVDDADVTLAAGLDCDTNAGDAGSLIQVIGYAYNGGSPVNDGTKVTIDGNSTAANCTKHTKYHWSWQNFAFANATSDNVSALSAQYNYWLNCDSYNSGRHGWAIGLSYFSTLAYCRAWGNAVQGIDQCYSTIIIGCTTWNNAAGVKLMSSAVAVGCVAYNNADHGIRHDSALGLLINCVSDCNRGSGTFTSRSGTIALSRFTNNAVYGHALSTATLLDLFNLTFGNGSGAENGSTVYQQLKGSNTRIEAASARYADVTYEMDFDSGSGTAFVVGETVTGGTNSTTAVITEITDNGATGTIKFKNQDGIMFADGETLTGSIGGKTATVDGYPAVSGTPDYRLKLGADGFRQLLPVSGAGPGIYANIGLPNVPLIRR